MVLKHILINSSLIGFSKIINDSSKFSKFTIKNENGDIFYENNTFKERLAIVLFYEYKLINIKLIQKIIYNYIKQKSIQYNTPSSNIYLDIKLFLKDNSVKSEYEILKLLLEIENFESILLNNKIKLNELQEKYKNINNIPKKIVKKINKLFLVNNFISVNDFFIRQLNIEKFRPIIFTNNNLFISPCDSRCLIYSNLNFNNELLIKRKKLNYKNLLNNCRLNNRNFFYNNVSLCIFRLATVDYHYCHSPIDCTLIEIYTIDKKSFYSVQPKIKEIPNIFLENRRHVLRLRTTNNIEFYMIIVGAIGVDVIKYYIEHKYVSSLPKLNTFFKKGDPMCRFHWGGSTILLLFNKKNIEWNNTIINNSDEEIETYIKVRSSFLCKFN